MRKSTTRLVFGATAVALALSLSACSLIAAAPYARSTSLTPTVFPPRPSNHPIQFFVSTRPRCAFREIATIRASASRFWQSRDDVLEALRAKAREVGGDAVVDFREESVVTGASENQSGGVDLDRAYVPQGIVIRYTEPTCTE
jgi:hypothetical protein